MKSVYILRSVPGAGKSTLANDLAIGFGDIICCADDYHMIDGEYIWCAENGYYAHRQCYKKFETLITEGSDRIIVANTNTSNKDIKKYIQLAELNGYIVFSLVVENRHGGKNIHDVSDETLDKMEANIINSLKLR